MIFGFTTGGAELMLADIMSEQAEAGHDVTLLVVNRHYEEALLRGLHPKVKVVLANRPEGSRNPWWLLRYNLMLRHTRPDVVHFHQTKGAYITPKWRGVTFAVTIHDTGITQRPHPKRIDKVFAISKAVHDDMLTRFGIDTTLVINGIPCRSIATKDASDTLYTPGCHKPLRMVTVARLMHTKKGQDIAIQALALLKKNNIDATLTIVGTGESEHFLRNLADKCGVADKVIFSGNRSRRKIYSFLHSYDLFLLPSRYEGFGLTVAEAMAAQVPVAVSDIEGPLEIIEGGRYGSAFRCGDSQSLADTIACIANDYTRFGTLARTDAYRHVCRCYDIARTARQYIESYITE